LRQVQLNIIFGVSHKKCPSKMFHGLMVVADCEYLRREEIEVVQLRPNESVEKNRVVRLSEY